ncbi:type II toxin -antitoxin system TacA 1-like antitoxin [Nostoc sp.]|uniref:type II toxin -antitoxin system TacA 1-like antitoxin n=1 Tax=Nostoc sp. TaxID=1180 RepID=UPI002FF9B51D
MAETRINIRISPERKDALLQKVKDEGKNVTDVLVDLIDRYVGNKVETGEILELRQRVQKLEEVVLGEIAA